MSYGYDTLGGRTDRLCHEIHHRDLALNLLRRVVMKIISRLALLTALLIASNLASACTHAITAPSTVADAPAGSNALTTNTMWTLRSMTRAGSPEVTVADPIFTVTFGDDGKIAVRADCNRASASTVGRRSRLA
jgi:hypothetical protein